MIKIPDAEYFAHKALNCGGIKKILNGTPAHFVQKSPEKDCFIEGRAFHVAALEPQNLDQVLIAEEGKKRTSAQIKQGCLKFNAAKEVMEWANALRDYDYHGVKLGKIFDACEIEVSHFWTHDFGDFQVPCKIKIDAINHKHKLIFDAKSCKDASESGFSKALYNRDLAYYIQEAFYTIPPELKGYRFIFACVEKTAPYCTGLWCSTSEARYRALLKIEKAAKIYHQCKKTGTWSSQYNNEPETIPAPNWL